MRWKHCSLTVAAPLAVWLAYAQSSPDDAFIGARGRYWAFQRVERPAFKDRRVPAIIANSNGNGPREAS